MKIVFPGLFLMVVLSGFAMAASEVSTDFVVGEPEDADELVGSNFWSFAFWVLIVLIVVYVFFRAGGKRVRKKKARGKKGNKRK